MRHPQWEWCTQRSLKVGHPPSGDTKSSSDLVRARLSLRPTVFRAYDVLASGRLLTPSYISIMCSTRVLMYGMNRNKPSSRHRVPPSRLLDSTDCPVNHSCTAAANSAAAIRKQGQIKLRQSCERRRRPPIFVHFPSCCSFAFAFLYKPTAEAIRRLSTADWRPVRDRCLQVASRGSCVALNQEGCRENPSPDPLCREDRTHGRPIRSRDTM